MMPAPLLSVLVVRSETQSSAGATTLVMCSSQLIATLIAADVMHQDREAYYIYIVNVVYRHM
jgi:hypothetical protein